MSSVNPNVFPNVLYCLYDQRYLKISDAYGTTTYMPLSYLDTDAALTADSDVKVPSQKAVKSYIDSRPSGTSTDTFTSTLTIKGVEDGDATLQLWADEGDDLLDKWSIVSTAAGFLEFRNNTLTVISIGEYSISSTFVDTDTTLAADSDEVIPSQKAVKAYVDSSTGGASTSADYTIGESLSKGDVCYVKSDGKMWKSLASDVNKMPVVAMANESVLVSTVTNTGGVDQYTVLMLHMDGVDGSTTFTDSSAYAHNVTATGNAQVDTAQKVFGSASGIFDGAGDYLATLDSDDWYFGSGDFTLDFWVYFSTLPSILSVAMLFEQYVDSTHFIFFGLHNNGGTYQWRFQQCDGVTYPIDMARNPTVNATTWYHVALVRTGNTIKIFQDGTQVGADESFSGILPNLASTLRIGCHGDGNHTFNGYLDEYRLSKGIARWTANFTPPTAAYTTDNTGNFKLFGDVTVDTWSWTPGSLLYAGETEGTLTHTRPSDSGDQVQILGVAVSSTRIIFNPAMVVVEIA